MVVEGGGGGVFCSITAIYDVLMQVLHILVHVADLERWFQFWIIYNIVIADCPLNWYTFEDNCYKFSVYPPRTYNEAAKECEVGTVKP